LDRPQSGYGRGGKKRIPAPAGNITRQFSPKTSN
jgi:hypothetical protein